MMEITQEKLDELKSQIQVEESLGTILQETLVVGETHEDTLLAAAAEPEDFQSFKFDIKLLKLSGSICKSGNLDFRGSVIGVEIAHTTVNLSKGEICWNPKLGKLVGVKYCFSFKNNCLHTRGQIDGWFEKRASWNEKILCF